MFHTHPFNALKMAHKAETAHDLAAFKIPLVLTWTSTSNKQWTKYGKAWKEKESKSAQTFKRTESPLDMQYHSRTWEDPKYVRLSLYSYSKSGCPLKFWKTPTDIDWSCRDTTLGQMTRSRITQVCNFSKINIKSSPSSPFCFFFACIQDSNTDHYAPEFFSIPCAFLAKKCGLCFQFGKDIFREWCCFPRRSGLYDRISLGSIFR